MAGDFCSIDNGCMARRVTPNFKPEPKPYFFRAWRKHRGLTLEQLADRVDMAPSSISQLERGLQGFTDSTLEALAHALQCKPGDLLSKDPAAEGQVVDLMRLIEQKGAQASVLAFLNALPDKTGTDGG